MDGGVNTKMTPPNQRPWLDAEQKSVDKAALGAYFPVASRKRKSYFGRKEIEERR